MISSIGSGSGSYDASQIQLIRAKAAEVFMQKVDSDQDGKITEEELSKATATQDGKQSASTADLFKQLDQGGKGYVTKQDLEAAMAKSDAAKQSTEASSSSQRPSGPPPAGGGGGGAAAAASSSTSTAVSTDPADTNGDGTVTIQEQQKYAAKLYESQRESQTSSQSSQRQSIWQKPVYA